MSYAQARAFRPWTHGELQLRNRIVMAPMTRRRAISGAILSDESIEYYARRARGGVGLIISEGVPVDSKHAQDADDVPRIESPEQISAWRRAVEAIHEAGAAFAPQLWHTGRFALDPIAPSELPAEMPWATERPRPKAMSLEDMAQVKAAFASSALSAKEIGAKAVELHGAHGYLLASFLDARFNHRTDAYGGDLERRMHFPLEVLRAVREAVGPRFPIIYRFSQWSVDDFNARLFQNPEDLGLWVDELRAAGADILHVSTRRLLEPAFPERGLKTLAGWARELSGLPVIAVGGIAIAGAYDRSAPPESAIPVDDPGPAFELLDKGEADLLAIGRSLITNPDWVKIVRDGDWRKLSGFRRADLSELY